MFKPIRFRRVLVFQGHFLVTFLMGFARKCDSNVTSSETPCEHKLETISANIWFQPKPNCGVILHCVLSVPVLLFCLIQHVGQKIQCFLTKRFQIFFAENGELWGGETISEMTKLMNAKLCV